MCAGVDVYHPSWCGEGGGLSNRCASCGTCCVCALVTSQACLTNATSVTENYFVWRVRIISLALDTDYISSGFIHWSQGGKKQYYIMHTTAANLARYAYTFPTYSVINCDIHVRKTTGVLITFPISFLLVPSN